MTEEKHDMVVKKEEPEKTLSLEKKGEETIENPEEVETPEEETTVSEQETEEKKPEVAEEKVVTQKEIDKLYARMKVAEEKAKKAEAKLVDKKPVSDTDAILEVQTATKDLVAEEVVELQLRAKANEVSLTEAREDPNFKLWQEGHNAKVEKEKALNPSTAQETVEIENPMTPDQRLKEVAEKYKGDNAKIQEENEKILNELTCKDPVTGEIRRGLVPMNAQSRK